MSAGNGLLPVLTLLTGLILAVVGILGPLPRVKLAGQIVLAAGFLAFLWQDSVHGWAGGIALNVMGFLACAYGVACQAVGRRG